MPSFIHPGSASADVRRITCDLTADDLASMAAFYRELLGLKVVMDHGWVIALAPPGRPESQLLIVANDQTAPVNPAASIEVDDLGVVWRRATHLGAEIVYPRSAERWGVERFFIRDPGGNVVNILNHRSVDD